MTELWPRARDQTDFILVAKSHYALHAMSATVSVCFSFAARSTKQHSAMWFMGGGGGGGGGGTWSNWARDDLKDYRDDYPAKREDPTASDNLAFYKGTLKCRPEGKTVTEIHAEWAGDYDWLEMCHSYIQWLFPIQEAGLNPQAQVLMKHERDAMKADAVCMHNLKKSYSMMLDFYGFTLVDDNSGAVVRRPKDEFEARFDNLNYSSHNYLRITRMLKCLGEMGLESWKGQCLAALEREIYETKFLPNCRRSYEDYWTGTVKDDGARKAIVDRYKAAPAPPKPKPYFWGNGGGDYDDDADAEAGPTAGSKAAPAEAAAAAADDAPPAPTEGDAKAPADGADADA